MRMVKNNDFISGQYVWTGFDYIGEPTPFPFPSRSSYFGIIDLAGFPKDVYYMYQSEWAEKPVLHLFPHWNWKEGQKVDLWVYYNQADEVELFVNGKSQGTKRKGRDDFHVAWRVRYEPGTVKAVSRKDGKEVLGARNPYGGCTGTNPVDSRPRHALCGREGFGIRHGGSFGQGRKPLPRS